MSGERVNLSDSPERLPAWRADLDHSRPLPTEPLTGWRASLTRTEIVGLIIAGLSIVIALVGLAVTNELGRAGSVVPVVMPPVTPTAPSQSSDPASSEPSLPVVSPTREGTSGVAAARSARTVAAAPKAATRPATSSATSTATSTVKPSARPTPSRSPVASVTRSPSPTAAPSEVHYRNCAQVRAEHPGPLVRGDPGYRDALDKDGDGIACNEQRNQPGR